MTETFDKQIKKLKQYMTEIYFVIIKREHANQVTFPHLIAG